MIKNILIILLVGMNFSFAEDLEITNWFNKESQQFLEIMNNSNVEKHYNFINHVCI